MVTLKKLQRIILVSLTISVVVILAGCNGAISSKQPTASEPAILQETTTAPIPTPSVTPPPGIVRLVTQAGFDAAYIEEIDIKLDELSAQAGLVYSRSETLAESELESTRAVIWIGDPTEFNRLAAAAQEIPFVHIGSAKLDQAKNIFQIHLSPARVNFIAGLITVLIAPDRRAGGLFSVEDPDNAQWMNAFVNGAAYFCGRCMPVYAPVISFPITSAVSESQGFQGRKSAFDQLDQNRLEVLYLTPQAVTSEMLDYLASQSIVVVGSGPPPEGYNSIWAATVTENVASMLDQLWSELFQSDVSGQVLEAPIAIRDINDQILSPGRQQLVEKIASDLVDGWIEPLSIP